MKKLLSVGNIIACLCFILSLVGLILYVANVNGDGFFKGHNVDGVIAYCVLAMVFSLLIIAASFLPRNGIVGKIVDIVVMVLKGLIPVMMFLAVMALTAERVAGFGYIFFSNEDVRKEVATPANLASAYLAITTLVFDGIAAVAGIVGSFFLLKKED